MSNRDVTVEWALLAIALVLVNASLTFINVWPTPMVRLDWAVSIEAAACALALTIAAWLDRRPSPRFLRVLACVWVLLVIGRYAEVTTESLYGRDINLYWDLRNIPDVSAMLAFVARPLVLAILIAAAVVVPVVLYVPLRWALGTLAVAASDPRRRRALAGIAIGALVLGVANVISGLEFLPRVPEPMTAVYAQQVTKLAIEMSGASRRPLPPAPDLRSNLARVAGADVFVFFIESYGAVSWERPEFVRGLASARARLAADVRETHRGVVSAYVTSPTFGGKSWLAHISLLSGTDVRDEDTNAALMREPRDTLVTAFHKAGYRTVAIMPGLQHAWPEGAFYGFDEIYGADRLAYNGPPFGWWDITDQFVVARMDALFVAPSHRLPVFAFLPTISTHAPFIPTPPYESDWHRVLTSDPYPQDAVDRAWLETPDWTDLGPGYVQALAYAYQTIGGYLRLRADRDFVMILLGDHQPAAAVSGERAPWEVPMHVITNRRDVLDALRARGFRDGLPPSRPPIGTIGAAAPLLLDAFGE